MKRPFSMHRHQLLIAGASACFLGCLVITRFLAFPTHHPAPEHDPPKPPEPYTNLIGMKFVWIAPGTFMMGSPKAEKEMVWPQHKVTLTRGFYMGVYTVTQEQWQKVMGKNPSRIKGEKKLPVVNVSWLDCQDFCEKLAKRDKIPYRLPTESEWEYACRAGTTTPFYFGETISTDQANYNGEAYANGKKGVDRKKATPVGIFPANAWGLHDMHGNVWQWCQDWVDDYPKNDVVDPQGPDGGQVRALRGGAFALDPRTCQSFARAGMAPGSNDVHMGMRVCFSVD